MGGQDEDAGRRKVVELVKGIDYALFTTQGTAGDPLHARPMALREVEDDGTLWFNWLAVPKRTLSIAPTPAKGCRTS